MFRRIYLICITLAYILFKLHESNIIVIYFVLGILLNIIYIYTPLLILFNYIFCKILLLVIIYIDYCLYYLIIYFL